MNELLRSVGRVDPPPFLFTRIEARIVARNKERPSRSWVLATGMAMAFLLTVNSYFLLKGSNEISAGSIEQLASGMEMNASNQLYHD